VQSSDFGVSSTASVSANGRYVAFESAADNLVANDTNDNSDVFLRDRKAGTTRRMSLGPQGVQGNGPSRGAIVAPGGRYVGFSSLATNLAGNDTNGHWDAFVRDRGAKTTERVSIGSAGAEGNNDSFLWAMSEGGRFVALVSDASNLVTGDTNAAPDVFVRDRQANTTTRVSVATGGGQANGTSTGVGMSANGRFVAFESDASNLVAGDTNGVRDIFLRDLRTGTTALVSRGQGGLPANGISFDAAISANGRYVVYHSEATNLAPGSTIAGVFIYDRQTGATERVPRSDDGSAPVVSSDGRFVAFYSGADTIVSGDTNETNDVFLRDRVRSTTRLLSVALGGGVDNDSSEAPAISADGSTVAFESQASNLVPKDTNKARDIFARVPAH
jgi:Tol biopolymer transport system component